MLKKRLLAILLAILLAACATKPAAQPATGTPLPSLPPGVTPTITNTPTETPSPTPTPGVRLATADQAFFDGDYINAQLQYQTTLSNTADPAMIAAALWGLGRVEYTAWNNGKALIDLTNLATNYPGDPNAIRGYFLMGEIYMALQRYP